MTSHLPKVAAWLYGLSVASLILFPLLLGLGIFLPEMFGGPTGLPGVAATPPQTLPQWAATLIGLVPMAFVLLALDGMRRLFRLYRQADPLSPAAGPLIKAIGRNLLIAAILGIAVQPLVSLLSTLNNPVGQREISVGISTGEIGFVLVAGLLTLVGWSMTEASRIAEENRGFV